MNISRKLSLFRNYNILRLLITMFVNCHIAPITNLIKKVLDVYSNIIFEFICLFAIEIQISNLSYKLGFEIHRAYELNKSDLNF